MATLDSRVRVVSAREDLATEWHPKLNGDLSPADVSVGSKLNAWRFCPQGHAWQAKISNRARGRGRPVRAGSRVVADREAGAALDGGS